MKPPPVSLPIGIVVRRSPGATRWAKWAWKVTDVLPGAGPADWREIRREGDVTDFHAATVSLDLWPSDTEAYLHGLSTRVPSVYVVLRQTTAPDAPFGLEVTLATVSPYEAQDYQDSGEEIVEAVPMPDGLIALVRDFAEQHHEDEVFVKRKRDKKRVDLKQDGIGDPRVRQAADVYRAPASMRKETMQ